MKSRMVLLRISLILALGCLALSLPRLGLAQEWLGEKDVRALRTSLEQNGVFGADIVPNVEIAIPAREGIPAHRIWGALIRPSTEPRKLPTILIGTGYRREFLQIVGIPLVLHDYNVLAIDLPGTGSAEMGWTLIDLPEQHDTQYVIDEFIPKQPWSDGKVGMSGMSYMGIIQLLAAGLVQRDETGEPLHLKAIFPVSAMSDAYRDVVVHGSFDMEFMTLWIGLTDMMSLFPPLIGNNTLLPQLNRLHEMADIWTTHLQYVPETLGNIFIPEREFDGEFYDRKSPMIYWPEKPPQGWGFKEGDTGVIPPKLPVFLTEGWFDLFTPGVFDNYAHGLKNHAQEDKRMIVGEWYHADGCLGLGITPMTTFSLMARWFDWKIKGKNDPFMTDFPVVLYAMGENRWKGEKSWPLPEGRTEPKTFYLSKTAASPIQGDWFSERNKPNNFALGPQMVASAGKPNPVLVHDPRVLHGLTSRSTTRWAAGATALVSQVSKHLLHQDINAYMPFEDERPDEVGVLTFTTEPFKEDFEVVGPLQLNFFARTTFGKPIAMSRALEVLKNFSPAFDPRQNLILGLMYRQDVSWVVEVNDVFPAGRARNVTSGWLAASHKPYDPNNPQRIDPAYDPKDPFYDRSDRKPSMIEEGKLYQYSIEIWPTDNVFKKGHRMRLSLSGSDFPHIVPVMIPSENAIVIDEAHPATLSFDRATSTGEGELWKWIDNIDDYLRN